MKMHYAGKDKQQAWVWAVVGSFDGLERWPRGHQKTLS
ncbi:hypothetical protein FOZG_12847 [Fusarium oxysporum Fo47]|uniref:Uncharacterized protein n=1 Tax=Fusarium oxysporum Fo47 TaxID=660027 RepID=W9JUY8_FUSOX|nr:hypothetical protein FOZG_12847 [Fusarium oxysporum Fo47]